MTDLGKSRLRLLAVAIVAVLVAGSCSKPAGQRQDADSLVALELPPGQDAPAIRCMSPARGPVRLSGILTQKRKFGPPGYGETPKRDQKLTILILRLTEGLDVCGDTAAGELPLIRGVNAIQLTGRVDSVRLKPLIGHELTVYGTLHHKTWGTDFTDILIRVDSIPLEVTPPTRRS